MSHPLYNPYASGNHSSGTSSVTSANSGGIFPSLLPQTVSYRPEQSRAIIDKNMSVDMHISRARNGVRLLEKTMDPPIDSRLTRIQRESPTGMVSYPQPMPSTSASLGHRDPGVESVSSSSDWSSNYVRPTAAEPLKFYLPPASSNDASDVDGRFIGSSERERVKPSLSGVVHFEHPLLDKPAALTESSQYKYTSESDSDILLHFGLSEEDLEHLISYPEGHITPANLPFILRQIRIEKTKRATTAAQSTPCPEPQPASSVSGTDSHAVSRSGRMHQEEISPAVLEPSKAIDCECTDEYTEGAGDETGSIGRKRENCGGTGSVLLIETYASSGHIGEPPPKNTTEVKSSALGVSHDQASLSSLHSVAPPSNDETQLQTQPNHSSQAIPIPFSLPKTDADFREVESEASKPVPLKDPEVETRPPCTYHCGVHPSRPDLALIDSNGTSGNVDQSRSEAQESTVVEQIKKQQPISQMQQQQKQNEEKQPVSQTRPDILPSVFSATKSVSPASHILIITGAVQQLPFLTVGPPPTVSRPALPQPIPDLPDLICPPLPTSNKQPLAKVSVSKDLPTAAMAHGSAAAAPKIFPHTCCLCNRRCLHMKDWVSHQNSSLHLENCKPPRKRSKVQRAET